MNGSINFDGTLSGSIAGGGGGGGSEVSITPVVTEGTKIADYTINSASGSLYAPEAGDTVEVTPTLNVGDKVADIAVNGVNKALYSQSYGYANDMHDTNYETIGGLQKGSNITPIMVKAVSYADQSGVDGETIGVLSVGDTDYLVKQKKVKVINYSLNEQDTGKKWVDGSDIYVQSFLIPSNINITTSWIDLNITVNNIQDIIRGEAVRSDSHGAIYLNYRAYNNMISCCTNVGSINLGANSYVTLFYTKAV